MGIKMAERNNSGAVFKNDRKEKDTHPDYKGSVMIGGVEYWASGWIKTAGSSARNPGSKFLSLAFEPKSGGGGNAAPARSKAVDLDDDDIPF